MGPDHDRRVGRTPTRAVAWGVAAGVLYFALGLAVLVPEPWEVPVGRFVYPSAGIGFGLLFVYGLRMWPVVALAAAGVTWLTGSGPLVIVLTAIGNALEAVIAPAMLSGRRRERLFERLSDVGLFALAGLAGAGVSATLGVVGMALSTDLTVPVLTRIWWMWILGHSLGMVLFGSPFAARARIAAAPAQARAVEGGVMLVGVALVSVLVFSRVPGSSGTYPLQYLGYPFLIWAALRLHLTWLCLANMVLGGAAMAWTAYGVGPLYQGDGATSLVYGYVFALVSWLTTVVIAISIHQRQRSDRARVHGAGAYRALVEQAAEGIFVLDAEGMVVDVNQAAVPMMEIEPEEALGRSFATLLTGDDREGIQALLAELEPGATDLVDWEQRRVDGSVVDLQAGVTRLEHDGYHVFIRDVTRARELQRRLDRTHRMEAVGLLAGGVAHDFNNLLTVIMGHGSRGLDSVDPAHPAVRHLEGILRAARKSTDLTNQLLTFARSQPGRARVVDVDRIVDEAEDMMRRVLGEGVRYLRVSNGDEEGGATVFMDPVQLEQVLLNLVFNARDAMPRGGEVTVKTSVRSGRGGGSVRIEVRDTGSGIPEDVLDRVFEPFFSTKADQSRTGLGLAVSRRLLEAAGGRIEFKSEPGRGTTFRITLPRVEGVPEPRSPEAVRTPAGEGGGTVLLIEDEAELRELIREGLDARGYAVIAVPDGEAALDRLGQVGRRLDVLVTDVVLPGMAGTDVASRIRATYPDVDVLFISGYDLRQLEDEPGIASERSGLIRKPFTIPDLTAAVGELFEARTRRGGVRRADGAEGR